MARDHDLRPDTATNYHHPTQQVVAITLEVVNAYRNEAEQLDLDDVYIVYFTYILNNWKAILSTTAQDNRIYEVTHNAATGESYCDVYEKVMQQKISRDDPIHNI